ncbi:hypothetical protein GCM10010207_79250 [Streptomyces atratus]|nr:hypothetical protein GCM10010207_79250 [Streptomyces atratus]
MVTLSWTSTVYRVASHPLVRITATAALQALASHLAQQNSPRPSCTDACALVHAGGASSPAARRQMH